MLAVLTLAPGFAPTPACHDVEGAAFASLVAGLSIDDVQISRLTACVSAFVV